MSNQATAKIYRTGEVTDYMSISTVEHGGTWRVYKGPVQNAIDCIRIREALSGFHLEYRTWNEGVGKYYPYVNSEDGLNMDWLSTILYTLVGVVIGGILGFYFTKKKFEKARPEAEEQIEGGHDVVKSNSGDFIKATDDFYLYVLNKSTR